MVSAARARQLKSRAAYLLGSGYGAPLPEFAAVAPYTLALVRGASGGLLLVRLQADGLAIGDTVRVITAELGRLTVVAD